MKSFLKYTLATIVGIFITSFIMFFLFLGIIAALTPKDEPLSVKPNSILHIVLDYQIQDRGTNDPLKNFNFSTFESKSELGLDQILENIKKAKTDDNIKGIYLDFPLIMAGMATTEEIRNALIDFKESGKFILSYNDIYSQKAYYLASVADKIYVNPEGLVEFKGMRSNIMFLAKAFEKLGIEPQIIRHGKFKSAIEPFVLTEMSEANREQTQTYLFSIWENILKGISAERNISIDSLNMYADNMMVKTSKDATDLRLIDGARYKDEILDELKELSGIDKEKELNLISLEKYKSAPNKREHKGLAKDKIAVIYATGQINMGEGDESYIGSEGLSKTIREARLDSSVKAVVLRVNSPGGSALASEVIWREMILTKKTKPLIVSMGDVAASGGYYIAAPADAIVANPNTLTGSIGVFGILWNAKEFLNDKLGLTFDGVQTNKHTDIGSVFRPLSEQEKEVIQESVENVYNTFIAHVAEGRNRTKEEIDSIGQGRVWSGINAKEIGLIDEFGGLERAIELAAEKAGIDHYRTLSLPKQEDPLQKILKGLSGEVEASIIKNHLGNSFEYYNKINKMTEIKGVQARIPYDVEIY